MINLSSDHQNRIWSDISLLSSSLCENKNIINKYFFTSYIFILCSQRVVLTFTEQVMLFLCLWGFVLRSVGNITQKTDLHQTWMEAGSHIERLVVWIQMKQIQDSVKLRCFSTLWFITQVWIEAYQVCGVLGSNITSSSFLLSDEFVPNPVGHSVFWCWRVDGSVDRLVL